MFRVRAAYNKQLEIKSTVERVREFFTDLGNFVDYMPGVEKITREGGIARWLIRAEVPVIGSLRQTFAVEQAEDRPERIEWSPAATERNNFMRYVARFVEEGGRVLANIELRIEVRRQNARELHLLAGLAGEGRLSAEMQKGIDAMMQTFLQRARAKLENS